MRRVLQKSQLATWAMQTVARHGWPRILTHFAAGVGDELMLTAVIRELRRRGAPRFWVMTRRPELYQLNPDIAAVLPVDARVTALAHRCGARIVEPRYTIEESDGNLRPPPAHMITCLMATAGVTGDIHFRPILNLTPEEKAAAAPWSGTIVIQPTMLSAVRPNELKEWWPDRWQTVVDALRPRHRLVQVGGEADPLLTGVEDLRGHNLSLRAIAAILGQARLFVGFNSGFMHLARAVDCPAMILFGGHSHPEEAGYEGNLNLARAPACAPCWRYHGCELDRQCMRDITAAQVIDALQTTLRQPRPVLPDQTVALSPADQKRIVSALAR